MPEHEFLALHDEFEAEEAVRSAGVVIDTRVKSLALSRRLAGGRVSESRVSGQAIAPESRRAVHGGSVAD